MKTTQDSLITPGITTRGMLTVVTFISRDWGNVFSPPIILPSAIQNGSNQDLANISISAKTGTLQYNYKIYFVYSIISYVSTLPFSGGNPAFRAPSRFLVPMTRFLCAYFALIVQSICIILCVLPVLNLKLHLHRCRLSPGK